jgi:hypothetical protein
MNNELEQIWMKTGVAYFHLLLLIWVARPLYPLNIRLGGPKMLSGRPC